MATSEPTGRGPRARPPTSSRRVVQAAALSACPSSDVGHASIIPSSTGPATRSNTRRPATVAAALLPRPAVIGISLSTSATTVGVRRPVRCDHRRERPLHRVPAPAPVACSSPPRAGSRHRHEPRGCAPEGRAAQQDQACRIRRPGWPSNPGRPPRPDVMLPALSDTKQERYHVRGSSPAASATPAAARRENQPARCPRTAAGRAASSHASTVITNGSASLGYPGSWRTASRLMSWRASAAAIDARIPGRSRTTNRR